MTTPTVKVEIAFATDPGEATPVWTDVTAYVDLGAGLSYGRGRRDERSKTTAQTCTFVLDNSDGRFTPGRTASPYYPNVKIGKKVRVSTTVAGVTSHRFTGYVTEWPVSFPGGLVADSLVTATDRIGYLDAKWKLRSVPSQAILSAGIDAYWPLTDKTGATSAGEISGNRQGALTVATYGDGLGLVEFGKGTGPSTDGASALVLTPTSTTDGKYLATTLSIPSGESGGVLFITANTGTVAAQTLMQASDGRGYRVELGIAADGKLTGTEVDAWGGTLWTLTSPTSVADGSTHTFALTLSISGAVVTASILEDGTSVASTAYAGSSLPTWRHVYVGGNPASGGLFTGTLSHAFVCGHIDDLAAISGAVIDGLEGQNVTESVQQVAAWAGVLPADLVAETGELTATAHRDTADKSPAEVLQDLASDEGGVLFVDGSGRYRFQARSHRWTVAPIGDIDTAHLGSRSVATTYDTQGLANDVTATRPGGVGQRVVNTESVAALGTLDMSIEVAALYDSDVVARAGWEANYRATPYPRVGSLPFDLLTMTQADTLLMMGAEVGDTITVSTWPDQAEAESVDLTIEGWSERISLTEWTLTANTSKPFADLIFITDNPVQGVLDAGFVTVY